MSSNFQSAISKVFPANHKRAVDARGADGPEAGLAPVDTVASILERQPGGVPSIPGVLTSATIPPSPVPTFPRPTAVLITSRGVSFFQPDRSGKPAAFSMAAGRGDRSGWVSFLARLWPTNVATLWRVPGCVGRSRVAERDMRRIRALNRVRPVCNEVLDDLLPPARPGQLARLLAISGGVR